LDVYCQQRHLGRVSRRKPELVFVALPEASEAGVFSNLATDETCEVACGCGMTHVIDNSRLKDEATFRGRLGKPTRCQVRKVERLPSL
jgi:hypothetical protein